MKGTGRRHIQKLYVPVFRRIMFRGRVIEQYPVKFQAFRIFYRKHHDSLGKVCSFRIAVRQRKLFAQTSAYHLRFLFIPADHRNGFPAFLHPLPDIFFCFSKHLLFIFALSHAYLTSMTADRFHRINRKISMPQDFRCKMRNLHRVAVAFLQQPETVWIRGKHQFSQFFPVVQTVSEMNVLGHVAHDCIGTTPETVFQRPVCHHSKILCLVDDHMARLPDSVGFLDPFVQIRKRRQIVEIKCIFRKRHGFSLLCLCRQKLPVNLINGAFPYIFSKMPAVHPLQFLFLLRRIGDILSGKFIFQP